MSRAFADIVFTPAVLAEQAKRGAAGAHDHFMAEDEQPVDQIGPEQAAFIRQRDGFYQASVSETGWPYVQFRGGPRGFLKILDARTIAYSDYRGNRQHVSAGNVNADGRVSLILTDYPNQGRLKIWGHARLSDDMDLITHIHDEGHKGRPERAVVIDVKALDWNCPSHIPMRLTVEELAPILTPLREELEALRAENAALKAK